MYANVLVDIEGAGAPAPLTYAVPELLRPLLRIGCYVRVPLGSREALGYVVGLQDAFSGKAAKPISALVHPDPLFDAELLGVAEWMAGRYHASLAETLRCVVPEGLATRLRTRVSLQNLPDPEAAAAALERRSPQLASLLRLLATEGEIDTHALRTRWEGKDPAAALARLRSRGWIREETDLDGLTAGPRLAAAWVSALPPEALHAEAEARKTRAPAQAQALALFLRRGPAPLLAKEATALGASQSALRALAREGLLRQERVPVRRDTLFLLREQRQDQRDEQDRQHAREHDREA